MSIVDNATSIVNTAISSNAEKKALKYKRKMYEENNKQYEEHIQWEKLFSPETQQEQDFLLQFKDKNQWIEIPEDDTNGYPYHNETIYWHGQSYKLLIKDEQWIETDSWHGEEYHLSVRITPLLYPIFKQKINEAIKKGLF